MQAVLLSHSLMLLGTVGLALWMVHCAPHEKI